MFKSYVSTSYYILKLYFNHDERVVAIEVIFENVPEEKKKEILDELDFKYSREMAKEQDSFNYFVSKKVKLKTTIKGGKKAGYKSDRWTERNVCDIQNIYSYTKAVEQALAKKEKNKVNLNRLEISLIAKCNLTCPDCAHSCGKFPSDEMISLDYIDSIIEEGMDDLKKLFCSFYEYPWNGAFDK